MTDKNFSNQNLDSFYYSVYNLYSRQWENLISQQRKDKVEEQWSYFFNMFRMISYMKIPF